jgi:CrcB protein
VVLAWIGVGLVGGLGALARFWLDGAVSRRVGGVFPAGTLAVNLSGSVALGVLVGAGVGGDALLVAGTGFLGAYTTFSTWMLESERLGEDGRWRALALNLGLSLALGLAAFALGRGLA